MSSSTIKPTPDEIELLKELIFSEELNVLNEKISNISKQEHIAHHLPEAVLNAHEVNTEGLSDSLQEPLIKALQVGGRENCKPLSEALFPILGPAIRYFVQDTFQGMFDQLNESISNATSIKRLRWWVEAKLAGKDVSEYIMLKTLNYEVENILLVNPASGLLMQQVAKNSEDEENPELVSSMLVAIRSFIKDSFSSHEGSSEELGRFSFGEKNIFLESGPNTILAVVAVGSPPPDYRHEMVDAIESIHVKTGEQLEDFSGDMESIAPVCQPILKKLLKSHKSDGEKKGSKLPGIIALLLVGGLIAWPIVLGIRNNFYEARVRKQAALEAGIELVSFESPLFNKGEVKILRDPQAKSLETFFTEANIPAKWRHIREVSYMSMESPFAAKREAVIEAKLQEIVSKQQKQQEEIQGLDRYINNLPADQISAAHNRKINALEKRFESATSTFATVTESDFFNRYPIQESAKLTRSSDNQWVLNGVIPEPFYSKFKASAGDEILIDGSTLQLGEVSRSLPHEWVQLKDTIETVSISYYNSSSVLTDEGNDARTELHSLLTSLAHWYSDNRLPAPVLTVAATAISGSNKEANQLIVNQRLRIEQALLQNKFPTSTITLKTIDPNASNDRRGVSIQIQEPTW